MSSNENVTQSFLGEWDVPNPLLNSNNNRPAQVQE